MRLSTDDDRDEARAAETIAAALDAGVTWLDTAHAYGRDGADLGHNEGLVAAALARRDVQPKIVTKCGMTRPDGRWVADGRATAVLSGARASALRLGRAPDVLLLHAPDPRVPLATSVRALVRARDEGLALGIGISNVTRGQLEALDPGVSLAAVEVALGAHDDASARGGVVAWCRDHGVVVLAHSPLGGPARAGRLARDPLLRAIAARKATADFVATPALVMLAYLLALDAAIVPIPGARRPETAQALGGAARIALDADDLAALDGRFPGLATVRTPAVSPASARATAEVVVLMGLVGSGKSRHAAAYVERGYERLNRDLIGGTLRGVAQRLGEVLARGATRVVLDNTYVTRASRSDVLRVAHRAGALVRCVHLDTPAAEAQVNITTRMLERHGALLGGVALAQQAKGDPNLFAPTTLFRMVAQLERPASDEGFASIDVVPFVREETEGRGAVAIPLDLVFAELPVPVARAGAEAVLTASTMPILLFGWRPSAGAAWVARAEEVARALVPDRDVTVAVCPHAGGPPVCWCRPPLPGLWLRFAREHGIDRRRSRIVVAKPAHRILAKTLGLVEESPAESAAVRVSSEPR